MRGSWADGTLCWSCSISLFRGTPNTPLSVGRVGGREEGGRGRRGREGGRREGEEGERERRGRKGEEEGREGGMKG